MTHLQYSRLLTPAIISEALQRYRSRNLKPVGVVVRKDSGIEAGEVEGVGVEVSEKPRPKGYWWVVTE